MKKVKFPFLALAMFCLSIAAKAQTPATTDDSWPAPFRFSIGLDGGLPNGTLSNNYYLALGASIQGDIPVESVRQLFFTVNWGYNNVLGDASVTGSTINGPVLTTYQYTPANIHLMPLKVGFKYFPLKKVYVQGQAGLTFLLNKAAVNESKSKAFAYAPQLGVEIPLTTGTFIDAGVKYESTAKYAETDENKINLFALHVAYGFYLDWY